MNEIDLSYPLIIQTNLTLLLNTSHSLFNECQVNVIRFAELVKAPDYIHTYRITKLTIWNALTLGLTFNEIIDCLNKYSGFYVPEIVTNKIKYYCERYGIFSLYATSDIRYLKLVSTDSNALSYLVDNNFEFKNMIIEKIDEFSVLVDAKYRGVLKQLFIKLDYPVLDYAGYYDGESFKINLRNFSLKTGKPFQLRDYQKKACEAFFRYGNFEGGSGIVVLACGAGKTCVGIGVMSLVNTKTLVITSNTVAVRQWINELKDKTYLTDDDIGEYSSEKKEIKPITVTTYQMLMWHRDNLDHYPHFAVLTSKEWGLVIYDEVHLLPAPIFRATAQIQAKRRLGLTATLIREDGLEDDIFSLIGPKVFELPWKTLENQGHIAKANCYEIKVKLPDELFNEYIYAKKSQKYKICATNPNKIKILEQIIKFHPNEPILVIGQYIDQLKMISEIFNAPLITGTTSNIEREKLYNLFKKSEIKVLVVSKVANFAIDLPDASCAVQVSGTYGSRQEEAQRLGRILRKKSDGREAHFYTITTSNSIESEFSINRQLYLIEQGYKYIILDEDEFLNSKRLEYKLPELEDNTKLLLDENQNEDFVLSIIK